MKIIIDFRNTYNNGTAMGKFTSAFWHDMALLKYDHEFIFISNEKTGLVAQQKNMQLRQLKQTAVKWIDKKKLGKALHLWQADCLVTIGQTGFGIHHFFQKTAAEKKSPRLTRYIQFADDAVNRLPAGEPPATVTRIKPACGNVITSLSWAEAESIKTQYTAGKSFFLFTGDIDEQHNLVELLKAFSIFKKWQQSNMQLVIAGYDTRRTHILEEKLLTYKYRADVILLKNVPATGIAKLVAACYAVVYPAPENIFPLSVLWAVQSNKAVIATDTFMNRQITGAAAWVDKNDTAGGFARAMILLYKDEKHLQMLVQQSSKAAMQFSRGQMLEDVWQCITQ